MMNGLRHCNFMLRMCSLLSVAVILCMPASFAAQPEDEEKYIGKVLFIGDSMTGWLAERLNAYGQKNNFEVATVVWDGSTIGKWAKSPRLTGIIARQNPDVIFVSLGMNELLERNPKARYSSDMDKLLKAFGSVPVLWIGPPSWPGKSGGGAMIGFLKNELGNGRFFDSSMLTLDRQSRSNPHPSRAGMIEWMDTIVNWIPANTDLKFRSVIKPGNEQMSRGKIFIYKRMKETL